MPLEDLSPEDTDRLKRLCRKAGRIRFQNGSVEEVGKAPNKKWRGHYYVYEKDAGGNEVRRHKIHDLGLKSKSTRTQAKAKLREHIAAEEKARGTTPVLPKVANCTVKDFWDKVFRPMHEPRWKPVTRKEMVGNINRYFVRPYADRLLIDLTKSELQIYVNGLAERYSKSVVEKALIWSRAILEEAVDLEYLPKNPARKLKMPQTRKVDKTVVTLAMLHGGFQKLPARERLLVRLALVCGLRRGELLALRPNDIREGAINIDEQNRYGQIVDVKTPGSEDEVWLPAPVKEQLLQWISDNSISHDGLIFPNLSGRPLDPDNYREDFFNPAMQAAGLGGITLQICRRSCATYMQKHGGVKDIQAHLRHAQASTTLNEYIQEIPESVRSAVEGLDEQLFGRSEKVRKAPKRESEDQ